MCHGLNIATCRSVGKPVCIRSLPILFLRLSPKKYRILRNCRAWLVSALHGVAVVIDTFTAPATDVNLRFAERNTDSTMEGVSGQTQSVTALLCEGVDVNARRDDAKSTLHFFVSLGRTDSVRILLDNGADVENMDNEGHTPLFCAVYCEHHDIVALLIERGADVNTQDNNGMSPLSCASWHGFSDSVRILLDNGADIESRDNDGRTPLCIAVFGKHHNVVTLLIEHGADVNTQAKNGLSPLSCASWHGFSDSVRILLDNGADIESRDNDRRTPLFYAVFGKHRDIVTLLIERGADVNTQANNGISPVSFASKLGFTEIVRILLDNGADIKSRDNDGFTPLFYAVDGKHHDVVMLMVECGADVNTQGKNGLSPLSCASGHGFPDSVRLLLDNGADIESRDNDHRTPLFYAVGGKHCDIVTLLIERGADVNTQDNNGMSPFIHASRRGFAEIVRILLDGGADIESRVNEDRLPFYAVIPIPLLIELEVDINNHRSPLSYASGLGFTEIVQILLDNGADIESRDSDGRTPLFYAVVAEHHDLAALLIKCGADVNTQDNNGMSPLIHASWRGFAEIVRILLDSGADIDSSDNEGRAPLSYAVVPLPIERGNDINNHRSPVSYASGLGFTEIVQKLLGNGTDIQSRDNSGPTPLCCAVLGKHHDVVTLLIARGAVVNTQDNGGKSPLIYASGLGCTDSVRLLLDNGADIESRDNYSHTPLYGAVLYGHRDVVTLLMERGADVNTQNNSGWSPLSCAGRRGFTEIVRTLLDNSVDIQSRDNDGLTPLCHAVCGKHHDVVALLIEHGAVVNTQDNNGVSPVSFASWQGCTDIVRILLGNGSDIESRDNSGRTALNYAVGGERHEVVTLLIECGAVVNTQENDGGSPLSYASRHGFTEIARILLDNGADIESRDNDGRTPLYCGVHGKHCDIVTLLIERGADVNTKASPISYASAMGYTETERILVDDGADIESRNNYGWSPFFYGKHPNVVTLLTERGADVNTQANITMSPLSCASFEGLTEIVRILLDNGADIESRDNYSCTPLYYPVHGNLCDMIEHRAAVNAQGNNSRSPFRLVDGQGWTEKTRRVLDHGADFFSRPNDGHTPLFNAVLGKHNDVVTLLIERGADVNTKRKDGLSPLSYASWLGRTEIMSTLLDNGADIESRDNYGRTMLYSAVFNEYHGTVSVQVECECTVNTKQNDDELPHRNHAHWQRGTDMVRMSLEHDIVAEARRQGRTPLYKTNVSDKCQDMVSFLIECGADVNTQDNDGKTPLIAACDVETVDIVRLLLKHGSQVNLCDYTGWTALHYAARAGHTMKVEQLLAAGADVNLTANGNESCLLIAALYRHADVVQALVAAGADVNLQRRGDGASALSVASEQGNIDVVKLLVHSNAEVEAYNSEGATSPYWAAIYARNADNLQAVDIASYCGHVHIVRFLCDRLTGVNSSNTLNHFHYNSLSESCESFGTHVDYNCSTAVHLTTDMQIMRSLLENGADVEAQNVDGLRPIHCAARTGLVELVELLIKHGANVDAADVYGNRPLHEAVSHGLNIVQLIVQCGAKVNVQNVDGKTPLHVAIERQQSEVVKFLLNADADVRLTDVWRNTPLHYLSDDQLQRVEDEEYVVKQTKKCQELFIRNAVGVKALLPMTAHGILDYVNHKQETVDTSSVASLAGLEGEQVTHASSSPLIPCFSKLEQRKPFSKMKVYCRKETEHRDCYGNTPLHCAVGVYAHLKMHRVNTDISETVEFLVKRGADINVQNNDGLTPLHVAHGEQAIQACLQHADDQSFTITDKRGRNFWHLLFLLRNQNDIALATNIQPLISASDAKHNSDDLNRTPLHYACMKANDWTVEWRLLVKEFIQKFSDEHVNKQDRFGRTALHYAAMTGNRELKDFLKSRKAVDDMVQDNFEKTAGEYIDISYSYNVNISHLQSMNNSDFMKWNFRSVSVCIQQCFSDVAQNSDGSKTKLHKIISDLRADSNTSHMLSTYLGCRFDYCAIECRESVASKRFQQLELLFDNNNSATKLQTVFSAVQIHVERAMHHLAAEISDKDIRFACELVPVGSAHEETKIGCCNEFDYNFVLTDLSRRCEVCYSPESPPGFVLLKASAPDYEEDLFDSNGILNTRIVKFKFETLVKQILSSLSFCEATGFEFIDPVQAFFAPRGTTSTKLHTHIKLKFIKPVNGYQVLHDISVDVVPALRIDNWWPDDAHREDLCQTGDCLIVFTQPHLKYPWISWTQPHGFISFARAESRLLRECPHVIKAAFMVAKRMSKYFCKYELFSSHVIKTALFWCMDDLGFSSHCSLTNDSDEVNEDELLLWVQNILQRLLCFAAQDYVPSFFIPKCCQPVWLEERYLKQFHMRFYRHGLLSYTDLFSLSEQQSRDSLLKYIKSLLILSHVMYWSVLSDDDELKLFVPSTINPLTENDVCTTLLPRN